jgi:5-deoxy-glucuronate isomerase
MTAYDVEGIVTGGLDGGKVLLRIARDDAGTAPTLEACARAVTALARQRLPIMVEPLPYRIGDGGRAELVDDDDELVRVVAVAAGLGADAGWTWLKVPAGRDVARMLAVTTLPALILGGAPGPDPEATFRSWELAMDVPNVRGLVGALHRPAGSLGAGVDPVRLTPEDAGWRYSGLHVVRLAPGAPRKIDTAGNEVAVLPLSATDVEIEADGAPFLLAGRSSVFDRVTDFLYAGRDTTVTLRAEGGGEVALAMARCERRLPPRYGPAEDVAVEVRGAGPATRQVNNFLSPEAWPDAQRLIAVELLTPDGNWSSYPPHRHDDSPECPVNNEEIYYFRIARSGFGVHRLYTPDGTIDECAVVGDGDVFLIPRGYHGPCISAPGYPMYYLNVLAGAGPGRSMAFCDDPAHHWVRDAWAGMAPDPRCPMTTAAGVRDG